MYLIVFSKYRGDVHIISLEEKNGGEQKSPITVLQEKKAKRHTHADLSTELAL